MLGVVNAAPAMTAAAAPAAATPLGFVTDNKASVDAHDLSTATAAVLKQMATAPTGGDGSVTPIDSSAATTGETQWNSHYCDGCTPPLLYQNGAPVVNTTGAKGFTITPIFWQPAGLSNPFPPGYVNLIQGYIKNVAAASGTTSNVYSIATEYYQSVNGVKTPLTYKITAGTPIIDTAPFPTPGCTPAPGKGYRGCVTEANLKTELNRLIQSRGLPTGLAHFYPVFFPSKVETFDGDGYNSDSTYCGYHGSYSRNGSVVVFANEPLVEDGCGSDQSPNGVWTADASIDTLSHEILETMTDPTGFRAWNDSSGYEIGDICAGYYGPPLGFTDPNDRTSTAYNQVINGAKYYTQTEFSNTAFRRLGIGNGCVISEAKALGPVPAARGAQAAAAAAPEVPEVASILSDVFPNVLDADGTSTSDLDILVADSNNYAVSGDKVAYSIYAVAGKGVCGEVSATSDLTDDSGHAHVTYTASTDDVICAVVGTELFGGRSASGLIYQGAYQDEAVIAHAEYPKSLTVDAAPVTFPMTFTNPTSSPVKNAFVHFQITAGDYVTEDVAAGRVQMSYSTTGPSGTFKNVDLTGSTITDGAIQGDFPGGVGVVIGGGKSLNLTVKIALKGPITAKGSSARMMFEAYLDQLNPGSGAVSTIADTLAYTVNVSPAGGAGTGKPVIDQSTNAFAKHAATASLSTTTAGDVLVAYVAGEGPSGTKQTANVTGGGVTWTLVKRTNTQTGTAEVWTARAPALLNKAAITSTLTAGGSSASVALTVVAFKGATGVASSTGGSALKSAPSVTLTSTKANSLTSGVGNDPTAAKSRTLGSNQKLLTQNKGTRSTAWVQIRSAVTPKVGTPVTINDSAPRYDKWNLTLVEVF